MNELQKITADVPYKEDPDAYLEGIAKDERLMDAVARDLFPSLWAVDARSSVNQRAVYAVIRMDHIPGVYTPCLDKKHVAQLNDSVKMAIRRRKNRLRRMDKKKKM